MVQRFKGYSSPVSACSFSVGGSTLVRREGGGEEGGREGARDGGREEEIEGWTDIHVLNLMCACRPAAPGMEP